MSDLANRHIEPDGELVHHATEMALKLSRVRKAVARIRRRDGQRPNGPAPDAYKWCAEKIESALR